MERSQRIKELRQLLGERYDRQIETAEAAAGRRVILSGIAMIGGMSSMLITCFVEPNFHNFTLANYITYCGGGALALSSSAGLIDGNKKYLKAYHKKDKLDAHVW